MDVSSLRVLIVEDDSFVAELLQDELRTMGVGSVWRASDGRAAVELCSSVKPDVVLMDVHMPEMDGIEAAVEIQERCPTPVVMLTVHAEQEVADRAAHAGVGAYLLKPASAPELLRAIVVARARFDDLAELRRVNGELRHALESVKTLSGLLPICASCKKIRDDQGYWRQVESYIASHTSAQFTHGICPDCMALLYPWMLEHKS